MSEPNEHDRERADREAKRIVRELYEMRELGQQAVLVNGGFLDARDLLEAKIEAAILNAVASAGQPEQRGQTVIANHIDRPYDGSLCDASCDHCGHTHCHDNVGRCLSGSPLPRVGEPTPVPCPCPYPHGIQKSLPDGASATKQTEAIASAYAYRVRPDGHGEFVATCEQFPSLSCIADTPVGAFFELLDVVESVIGDMISNHESIPQAHTPPEFVEPT